MKLFSDQPIKDKEDDEINSWDLAMHIAKGILNWHSKDSLCIALYGPWGSGKTSIINLLVKAIKEKTKNKSIEKQPIIMRFQPWIISGQEKLILSFIIQLRNILEMPGLSNVAHKAAKMLEKYEKKIGLISLFTQIRSLITFFGWIKQYLETLSKQTKEDLETNKKLVSDALSKLSAPIIITIDDIDRLTSEEIRQVFQLIKAVADFPNTIYILAFDYNLVEETLKQTQEGSEIRYLEKIVQLGFHVPNPSHRKLMSILWKNLENIIKDIPSNKYEQDRWKNLKFGPMPAIIRNFRDVKRYLNSVNFIYPIFKGEINPIDLIIIEAFKVFAPFLYQEIRKNREYLLSDPMLTIFSPEITEEKKFFLETLHNFAPGYCGNEIKEMLEYLFPEVDSKNWGDEFVKIWDENKRLCLSPYFDYYFGLTLPEGEVSSKEVKDIIGLLENPDELTSALETYMVDGRIGNLLRKIERYFRGNINKELIKTFLLSIFESGEELPLFSLGFLGLPSDLLISGTIYRLLERIPPIYRKDILIGTIDSCEKAISFPIMIVDRIWREWNPIDSKVDQKSNKRKLLNAEETHKARDAALSLLRRHIKRGDLHLTPNLDHILCCWKKWSGINEVKEYVNVTISDEKKIPEFLTGFVSRISSSEIGSYYHTQKFEIKHENLRDFCDVEELREKCENLLSSDPKWLTDHDKEIINIFLNSPSKNSENSDDEL